VFCQRPPLGGDGRQRRQKGIVIVRAAGRRFLGIVGQRSAALAKGRQLTVLFWHLRTRASRDSANRFGNVQEFHHLEASFAAFAFARQRLRVTQPSCSVCFVKPARSPWSLSERVTALYASVLTDSSVRTPPATRRLCLTNTMMV